MESDDKVGTEAPGNVISTSDRNALPILVHGARRVEKQDSHLLSRLQDAKMRY
jgi:hypothetical protein